MTTNLKNYVVVGSGSIAKRHIKNLKHLFPHSRVICISSSGRNLTIQETGADKIAPTITDAINLKPEWCIIASPASHHFQHALPFLEHCIPVLIEKPVVNTITPILETELVKYKNYLDVAYNFRCFPALHLLKEALGENLIGQIISVNAEVGQYLPDWRPDSNYTAGVSAQKILGGGALLELSHDLDYLTWLLGLPEKVFCHSTTTGILDVDVEDCVDALLYFRNGTTASLHLDFIQRSPSRFCKFIGSEGTLELDFIKNSLTYSNDKKRKVIYSDLNYDRNEMYIDELIRFDAFTRRTGSNIIGIDHALKVVKLIDVLKHSSRIGVPVEFGGND